MKITRQTVNAVACAVFCAVLIAVTVCAVCAVYSRSYAAETVLPSASLMEGADITADVNAERGAAFDFAALPAAVTFWGYIPERKPPVKLAGAVAWNVTAEAEAKAARCEDLTITGTVAQATFGDTLYAVEGTPATTVNVRFVDRSPTVGMTFNILPAYKFGTDELIMTAMIASFDLPFDWTGVTDTELQYSFGNGWHSLPVAAKERDWLNGANIQVEFVREDFAYEEDPYVFDGPALRRFITDLVHFRYKITGGLFEGYTNTVSIEGENSRVNDNGGGEHGGGSGILPNYEHGGSRGGTVAFWTSPGGTALAVVLGVVIAAACFGGGIAAGIVIYRRKKKNEKEEP